MCVSIKHKSNLTLKQFITTKLNLRSANKPFRNKIRFYLSANRNCWTICETAFIHSTICPSVNFREIRATVDFQNITRYYLSNSFYVFDRIIPGWMHVLIFDLAELSVQTRPLKDVKTSYRKCYVLNIANFIIRVCRSGHFNLGKKIRQVCALNFFGDVCSTRASQHYMKVENGFVAKKCRYERK